MKKKPASKSAFFNPRVLISFVVCTIGVLLVLAVALSASSVTPPKSDSLVPQAADRSLNPNPAQLGAVPVVSSALSSAPDNRVDQNDRQFQPNALLAILYDQTDSAGPASTVSQAFPDFPTFDAQSADDFVVPGGQTWTVQQVNVTGVYFNGPGPATSVNVFFYADAATFPGAAVAGGTLLNVPITTGAATGTFTIVLPSDVILTAGTYWVSVQANMSFVPTGEWGWTDRTVTSNSGAAWQNPGNGFASGCTTWGRKTTCVVGSTPDQLFQILGTSGGVGVTPTPTATPTASSPGTPTPTPSVSPGGCSLINGGLNPQPLTESGVAAPAGFFWSEVQHDTGNNTQSNTNAGYADTQGTNRLADNFTLTQDCTINNVVFYGYLTGSPATPSPFTAYTLQIWNGRPADAGSVVVFGDTTTNRLASSVDSTYFRIFNTVVPPPGTAQGTTRKIWRNTVTAGITLPPGTYWVDWASTVTGGGNHFAPAKTIPGSRGAAGDNARQFAAGAWADVVDAGFPAGGTPVPQDFPFEVNGAPSGGGTPSPTVSPGTPSPTPTVSPSGTPCGSSVTFSNSGAITIPATGTGATTGAPANPYPSNIAVAGLSGTVTKVTVRLNNLAHTFPDDIDVLLVGPGGQTCLLMSDNGGDQDVTGVTLTFDDAAATSLPDGNSLVSGTFKPSNIGGADAFPAPAPAPGTNILLSVFNGTAANGTWALYVVDDAAIDIGSIANGWDITITTGTGCPSATPSATVSPGTPSPTATPSPVVCSWTAGTVYPIIVADAASVTLGGNLYVFGGFSNSVPVTAANKFDGTTWTPIAPLPAARASSGAVTDGTFIYILNGATTGGAVAPSLFRYDPVANSYTTMTAPTTGSFGTAAVFLNGKIYRICGDTTGSGTNQTNTVEAYTVATNTWAPAANFPAAVSFANAIAGTNVLYAGGGVTSAASDSLITAVYDPVANTWNDAAIADLPATPAPHWGASNAVLNGKWVIGPGASGGAIQSTAISWDPNTNIWTTLPNAPLTRYRCTGSTLNNVFYSIGGNPFSGTNDVQKLTCPTGGGTPSPTVTPGTPSPSPTCAPGLSEGFDDITTLPAAGWVQLNHSTTVGTTGWFQGNDAVFPAQGGALPNSYIGANFNNTTGTNTISNWLLTPAQTLQNGVTMTFWTRTTTANPFPDRLQVRMSTNGASQNVGVTATDVGDFTALLLDINPTYTVGGYPEVWTQQTVTITGVPSATLGRLAFRYFVENGGPTGANSNYIGIDTFQFNGPSGCATPTPGTPSPTASPSCAPAWGAGPNVPPVAIVRAPGNYFPANGRFYSIGGRSADVAGADFTNPFEYNPVANSWATKPSTLPDGQVNNMACGVLTVSGTPQIYCVGGSQSQVVGTASRVFSYNPATDTFTVLAAGDNWPGSQTGTFLPGGFAVNANKLYIIGSFNANSVPPAMTAQVWQFDPTAAVGSKWLARADYPLMRGYVPAASIGGFIYTGGGSALDATGALIDSAESFKYDVAGNVWTPIANIPRATGETRAVVMNGTMWVLGGGRTAPNPSNQVNIFDPVAGTWSLGLPFATARRNFPADSNGTDRIFLAGGYDALGLSNTMEIFGAGVCATPSPTPTPGTPTPSPTITPATPTPTPTPGTPTPTPTASPSPAASPAQAVNFSTRMKVQAESVRYGIGGFIIRGSVPKRVILRAIGPSLTRNGIPDTEALADPVLELHGPGAFTTITNNNWRDTQEDEIQNTGLAPTNNLESAIVRVLAPGSYTGVVRGNGNTTGVALIEVYDLDPAADSRLANISTRAFVETGNNIIIAGFILGDSSGNDNIIVRGLGPSLSAFGVPNVLANPVLELRDSNAALILSNNDWQDNAVQAAIISGAGLAPSNNLEAALAANLSPGMYTALVSGLNNASGNGLVEVYDLADGAPFPTPTPGAPSPTPSASPTPPPGTPTPTLTPPPGTPSPSPSITPPPPPVTPTPSPTGCTENFDLVTAPALPTGWVATLVSGDPPSWETSTTNPDSAPNDAFVTDQDGISDKTLDSRSILVNSSTLVITFRHSFNTEHDPPPTEVFWDGYVLEISVNGGAFVDVTDPSIGGTFVSGPYTGEIDGTANNPLAGRMAWSGDSGGYITTTINLPGLASQTIKLRFRMGTDEAVAAPGVRVDTLSITGGSCP